MKKTKGTRLISLVLAMLMMTSLFSVTGVTVNAEGTSQMVFTYEDKTFTVDIGGTLSPENMAYILKDHSRVTIVEAYSSNSEYFEVRETFNEQEIVAKKPFTGTEQLTLDLFGGSETYILSVTCTEQPAEHPAVVPKCEQSGNIRYWTLGGYFYSDEACKSEITEADTVLPATDHDWNAPTYEWSVDRSTCTAVRTCRNDITHTQSKTANAVSRRVKDPTCVEKGETLYTAEFTNTIFEKQELTEANIPALEHEWNAPTYGWSSDGSVCIATRACRRDASHIETEIVNTASERTKDPTCGEKGETTYTAEFTNAAFARQEMVKADIDESEHVWNAPTYIWSDDRSVCVATRTCTNNASHVETEIASSMLISATAPSCEEQGINTYTAEFTDPSFVTQTKSAAEIAALGHNWGEPTYEWNYDNGEWTCTATRTCGRDDTHIETETVTASSVTAKDATCEDKGDTAYTAAFKNPAFAAQTKTVTDIDALGHRFLSFLKWVWNGFNNAVAWLFCDNAPDHVQTIDVPSVIDTVDTPDCTHEGYIYHTATIDVAGKTYTTVNVETLERLGHDWYPAYDWDFDGVNDGTTIPDYYLEITLICNNDEAHKLPLDVTMERIENEDGSVTFIGHGEHDGVVYSDLITVTAAPASPDVPTPDEPTPVVPTPDEPTPVVPTPDEPTPVVPTPDEPTPIVPTPDEPTPVVPTPDEPTPVVPTPDEPTPVVPTPDEPEKKISGILGDVNNDGMVDSTDALLILRNSAGLDEFDDTQRFLGDVSEDDGNIDSSDALAVLRYSVGVIDNEKIGTTVSKTVA